MARALPLITTLGLFGSVVTTIDQALPAIAEWKLRRELASHGFPGARFRVAAVERDRIVLDAVELAPGLNLGTVEVDAGWSLLWRDLETISIRGARIDSSALAHHSGDDGFAATIRFADSTLVIGDQEVAIAGTFELGDGAPRGHLTATAPELALQGRDIHDVVASFEGDRACATATVDGAAIAACTTVTSWHPTELPIAWQLHDGDLAASGSAVIGWSPRLHVRGGHAELTVPRWSRATATLDTVHAVADFAGEIDGNLALDVEATIDAAGVTVGDAALRGATASFTAQLRDGLWQLGDEPIRWTAQQLATDDATLVDARGTFELDGTAARIGAGQLASSLGSGTTTWAARRLVTGDATLIAPSGTVARDGTIEWRADRVVTPRAQLSVARGTVDRGTIAWAAERVATPAATLIQARGQIDRAGVNAWQADRVETSSDQPAAATLVDARGTVESDGAIAWSAASASVSARELGDAVIVEAPAGRVDRDGAVAWTATAARWHDVIVTAPGGRVAGDLLEIHATKVAGRDVEVVDVGLTGDGQRFQWSARRVARGRSVVRELTGTSLLDRGTHAIAWRGARLGPVELGAGEVAVASSAGGWRLERGVIAAYGGQLVVTRPTALDEVSIAVRGIDLAAVLRAIGHADGRGVLDGTLVLRDGELASADLAARGAGNLRFGDGRWLTELAGRIEAGQVAIDGRVAGALADFDFTRLRIVLAAGPALHVELEGNGRRIEQGLAVIVNVRGEVARLLREAT